jgi:membrane protease YdiL (CAAX protease family)
LRKIMERNIFSGWSTLAGLVAIFLGAAVVSALCVTPFVVARGGGMGGPALFSIYVTQFSLSVLVGWLWLRRSGAVKLRVGAGWSAAPMVLAGVVLLTAAGIVIEPLLLAFPDKWLENLARVVGRGGWAIATTVVAAPLLEELFFRGLMLERLSQRWRPTAAVMATALVFGLAHVFNPPQMINAFVMAIVMGYIYLASGSLVAVIAIHAINNALAYLQLELWGAQVTSLREMAAGDTIYYTIYAASVVVLAVSMILLIRHARTKNRELALQTKTNDVEKQP